MFHCFGLTLGQFIKGNVYSWAMLLNRSCTWWQNATFFFSPPKPFFSLSFTLWIDIQDRTAGEINTQAQRKKRIYNQKRTSAQPYASIAQLDEANGPWSFTNPLTRANCSVWHFPFDPMWSKRLGQSKWVCSAFLLWSSESADLVTSEHPVLSSSACSCCFPWELLLGRSWTIILDPVFNID